MRLNVVYNAIMASIKPPHGLVLLKFLVSFDVDMEYQLRERDPTTIRYLEQCCKCRIKYGSFLFSSSLIDYTCRSSFILFLVMVHKQSTVHFIRS